MSIRSIGKHAHRAKGLLLLALLGASCADTGADVAPPTPDALEGIEVFDSEATMIASLAAERDTLVSLPKLKREELPVLTLREAITKLEEARKVAPYAQSLCPTTWGVIRSEANSSYVSAEAGFTGNYYGMLRARRPAVGENGTWEHFKFCTSGGAYVIFASATGKWVSAEKDFFGTDSGMLRARADEIGAWEKFDIRHFNGQGYYALRAQANGKYVSVELDEGNHAGDRWAMLRARADVVDPWERLY
ncbi:MAG: hypothetical protein ABW252_17240 [Polyangiales bacterium]